ncbi:MAG: winged helix-turn-helix domain-containing protein [Rhizobiaceae bacterium]|nr:winged helix-turn-helix domain-containing protein [Rhizobiaceae bacterium]MCV0408919.1 winged helix-turn-helix domain-containing protein [Rhizobiaceae bacterium]
MRLLIHTSPRPDIAAEAVLAAEQDGIEVEAEPSLQEFGSRLYRDPEAIGFFWHPGWATAVETTRRLREGDVRNPLFVAIDEWGIDPAVAVTNRARVLWAGADDIQPWPVRSDEFCARLRALARRMRDYEPDVIEIPGGRFLPDKSILENGHDTVHLTGLENSLLELIVRRGGGLVTRRACMDHLYAGRDEPDIKVIDVFVCKLRKKLAVVCGGANPIELIWGKGYRFNVQTEREVA